MQSVIETVVVGQGHVERVETGTEGLGGEIGSRPWIRIVVSTIVPGPFPVPGGVVVGSAISSARFFADPEDGGGDVPAPRVNGLAVLVGIGWGLGRGGDPGSFSKTSFLGPEGKEDPEGQEAGDEEKAVHGAVEKIP